TVSQIVPTNVTFVSASSTRGSCTNSGGTMHCDVGAMASGEIVTVTLRLRPIAVGVVTHDARVTAGPLDYNLFNNGASALTTVLPPTLNIFDASVTEGDASPVNLQFAVRLTGSNSVPVSVFFATLDGTAQAGLDYVATNGVLVFAPGEINKVLSVAV